LILCRARLGWRIRYFDHYWAIFHSGKQRLILASGVRKPSQQIHYLYPSTSGGMRQRSFTLIVFCSSIGPVLKQQTDQRDTSAFRGIHQRSNPVDALGLNVCALPKELLDLNQIPVLYADEQLVIKRGLLCPRRSGETKPQCE